MKSGYKTSEFYVTLLAVLLDALTGISQGTSLDGHTTAKLVVMTGVTVAAAVYTASRSLVKSSAATTPSVA